MKYLILAASLLVALPAHAKLDAGDVQMKLDAEFGRGAVVSVAVDNGRVVKVLFGPGADKAAINARVADIDANHTNDKGLRELNQEINDEIAKLADDKAIDDLHQAEIRAKLIRAKEMSEPADKQQKLDEAKDAKVEAMKKPDNRPRIVDGHIIMTPGNGAGLVVLRRKDNPVLPQEGGK